MSIVLLLLLILCLITLIIGLKKKRKILAIFSSLAIAGILVLIFVIGYAVKYTM